jgi:hypothetical protein
LLLRR